MESSEKDGRDGAALPPERAFVLQLRAASGTKRAALTGRIEHVLSGRSSRFGSADEALSFIAQVLDGAGPGPRTKQRRGRS